MSAFPLPGNSAFSAAYDHLAYMNCLQQNPNDSLKLKSCYLGVIDASATHNSNACIPMANERSRSHPTTLDTTVYKNACLDYNYWTHNEGGNMFANYWSEGYPNIR